MFLIEKWRNTMRDKSISYYILFLVVCFSFSHTILWADCYYYKTDPDWTANPDWLPQITFPEDGDVFLCGSTVELTCTEGQDEDTLVHWEFSTESLVSDMMLEPEWRVATGGGEFLDNDNMGTSVQWIAPFDTAGSVVIDLYCGDMGLTTATDNDDCGTGGNASASLDTAPVSVDDVTVDYIIPELDKVTYGPTDSGKLPFCVDVDPTPTEDWQPVPEPEFMRDPPLPAPAVPRNYPACWLTGSSATAKVKLWYGTDLSAEANIVIIGNNGNDFWSLGDWKSDQAGVAFATDWTTEIECQATETISEDPEETPYTTEWSYYCPPGMSETDAVPIFSQSNTLYIAEVDLDVDSDNDGDIDDDDDAIEDDAGEPGKYVMLNNDDDDLDGVPDYADFDNAVENDFVEMTLNLAELPISDCTNIKFTYLDSDPATVGSAPDYILPGPDPIRIWTKAGSATRDTASIDSGGDFVPSGEFTADQLGITDADKEITLYVEAVNLSGVIDDMRIQVAVDSDGDGTYDTDLEDALRVIVFDLDFESLKVYDPKLENAEAESADKIIYTIYCSSPSLDPSIELTVMDGSTEVSCLVRKIEAGPGIGNQITKGWNGKWGIMKDGTPTTYNNLFADPKEYTLELNLYFSATSALPFGTKEFSIFVVRLGVSEMSFEDAGVANEEYDLKYHFQKDSDIAAGPGNDFPLTDPVWKIGPDIPNDPADKGDIDLKDGTPFIDPSNFVGNYLNYPEQDSTDPDGVEDDYFNRPVCYKVGSKPQIKVKMGSQPVSNLPGNALVSVNYGSATGCPEIKIEPANYVDDPDTGIGNDNEDIQPNAEYRLQGTTAAILGQNGLVTMGDLTIDMKFYYKDDAATWVEIPGYQRTTHPTYLVLNMPCDVMATPWVKVLHRAIIWAQGAQPADSEANIAENLTWAMENALNWNFQQGNPSTFEERWRRMTLTPPAATYDLADLYDEPAPVSGLEGGDCLAWAHTMSNALTALGIGPYGPDYVNEKSEDNFDPSDPWGGGYTIIPVDFLDYTGLTRTYIRGIYGGNALNEWQGVTKAGTGQTCYSVQGPHMATYDIMNDAPTAPPLSQPFDNIHAFEWYLWVRLRLLGEVAPYPPGYGEVTVGTDIYVYCTLIPNPSP